MKGTWREWAGPAWPSALAAAALALFWGDPTAIAAQSGTSVSGQVMDEATGGPVADVEVWIDGVGTRFTDANGSFVFPDVPPRSWVLTVNHVAYGAHWQEVEVGDEPLRLTIRIAQEGISLAPLVVEAMSRGARERRGAGRQLNRISREEIQRYRDTSMTLVELLTAQVPGIRITRSGVVGQPTCVEFRGARAGNFIRGLGSSDPGCNSPEVYLDGVLVRNPATLYATLPIESVENIELVQPSEAGARFGSGSLWGALVIETRRPGLNPDEDVRRRVLGPQRYDWSLEPAPHRMGRVFLGSAAGNAAGLAAGMAIASRCIGFKGREEDVLFTDCSATTTMMVTATAVALPALGSALGARLGGETDRSRGTLGAALIGAAVTLIPGYALGIAGQREETEFLQGLGIVTLTVAVPLVATLTDRLFRSER